MSQLFYTAVQNLETTSTMEYRKVVVMPGYPVELDLVMGKYR